MLKLDHNDELLLLMKERDGLSLELQALVLLAKDLDRKNSTHCVSTEYLIDLKNKLIKLQDKIDNRMETHFPATYKNENLEV